jgi:hypothetical protein
MRSGRGELCGLVGVVAAAWHGHAHGVTDAHAGADRPAADPVLVVGEQQVAARCEPEPDGMPDRHTEASEEPAAGVEQYDRAGTPSNQHARGRARPPRGRRRDCDPPPGPESRHPVIWMGAPVGLLSPWRIDQPPAGSLRDHLPPAPGKRGVKPLQPQHTPRLRRREPKQAWQANYAPVQRAVAQPVRPALPLDSPAIDRRMKTLGQLPVAAAALLTKLSLVRMARERPDVDCRAGLMNHHGWRCQVSGRTGGTRRSKRDRDRS